MYWTYNGKGNDYLANGFGFNLFGFNLEIKFYAICILIGIMVAVYVGIREAKKLGVNPDIVFNGAIIGVVVSIIGARLYYVIFEWDYYKNDLLSIFKINEGGLAIHGGIIAALIFVYFYTKYTKISLIKTMDYVAPSFLIGQIFGRWGNFFNQEAHGGKVSVNFLKNTLHLPDFIVNNMYFSDGLSSDLYYWHPTFLYESLWNLAGLIAMLIVRRKKVLKLGDLMPIYLIWYSIGRFFIEGMRTDSLMIGSLKQNQVISIILIIVGVALLILKRIFMKDLDYYVNYFVEEENIDEEPSV